MKIIYTLSVAFLLINFLGTNTNFALPYQLRRILLLSEDKEVIKTFDLISDRHEDATHLSENPSFLEQKYLKPEEKTAFVDSERRLLVALRKLAEKHKSIEVLWEISRIERLTEELFSEININYCKYIGYGQVLYEEFNQQQHNNFSFKNGDTYRFNDIGQPSRNLLISDIPDSAKSFLLRDIIAFIPQLLDPKVSKAFADLETVKNTKHNKYYKPLHDYWATSISPKSSRVIPSFMEQYVQPVANYFEQFLNKNPDMTIGEFRQLVDSLPTDIEEKILDIADAEFIIKPFTSDVPHTIIYAGGAHCDAVVKILTDSRRGFNGVKVIDIGADKSSLKFFSNGNVDEELYTFLTPNAWIYLMEDPQRSLMHYKSRNKKALVNSANNTNWEFEKIYKRIVNESDPNNAQPDIWDKEIMQKIMAFHQKASKTYIDFFNSIDASQRTLIFYTVAHNLLKTTDYLIKHGAHIRVIDSDGKTPLYYAQSKEMKKILKNK